MARIGIAGLEEDLARAREAVRGRSPPYERALALLPEVLSGPPGRFVDAAWEHRRFFAWYERPLLLLAALRSDALAEGPGHPLHAGFAGPEPDPEEVTTARLATGLDGTRDAVFDALAHRGVQTNETSRAIAWLWPAALARAGDEAHPLALADVGASAGLNLVADNLPSIWYAADGSELELAQRVRAVARLGLDPAPLDAFRERDARWLRACIWPGEREREERFEAALAAFRAARVRPDAPVLVPLAASNVPARLDLLSGAETTALVLAYQTVMRDYLEPSEREEYEDGMRDWLATHPPGRALWVELEPVAEDSGAPGAITTHVRTPWGELRTIVLARCGLHPRRLEVRHAGVAELRTLLRGEVQAGIRP
ncbi:MAG TPA: DUF2332 family protein [Anaeromyxobacter sp.]